MIDSPVSNDLPLDPIWRQASKEAVSAFAYGDVIPFEWLNVHLDLPTPGDDRLTVNEYEKLTWDRLRKVEGFRDEMLNLYKRYLLNVRGVGYKIIEPPHQTKATMQVLEKQLRRSLAAAHSALVNIDETLLSIEEARENIEARAKLSALRAMQKTPPAVAIEERITSADPDKTE